GGELDLVGAGPEERAGGLADAGRDALGLAGREVEHVDLVERVARLALALKDQALAVRRPVALARAAPFDGQPAHARPEVALLIARRGLRPHVTEDGEGDQRDPDRERSEFHRFAHYRTAFHTANI